MPQQDETAAIKASVPFRTIAHFYEADDSSPEDLRELSERAEEQIFREVLDAPKGAGKTPCDRIAITLPASDLTQDRTDSIISAVRTHFRSRSDNVRRDMRLTQKVGLNEIRLILAVCIPSFIGIAICSQFKGDPITEVIENVLIIFCRVTIWQPFQSLVFDRWTQSETARVYGKIAGMDISVKPV